MRPRIRRPKNASGGELPRPSGPAPGTSSLPSSSPCSCALLVLHTTAHGRAPGANVAVPRRIPRWQDEPDRAQDRRGRPGDALAPPLLCPGHRSCARPRREAGRTHLNVDICCRLCLRSTPWWCPLVRWVPARGRRTGARAYRRLSGAVGGRAMVIPHGKVANLPTYRRQGDALIWLPQRQMVKNKMRSPYAPPHPSVSAERFGVHSGPPTTLATAYKRR